MVKSLKTQQSFSGGEADPELLQRRDAEFYYQSVARARNVQAQVQGGLTHCGGTWLDSAERNPLAEIDAADFSVAAPNGGTAGDLTDGDTASVFQSDSATGTDFVVFEITMDTTTAVEAVDLIDFLADTADDQVLSVRAKPTGGSWTVLGTVDVRTTARTRRFAVVPGAAAGVDTIQLIVKTAGCGQVSIGEVRLWEEAPAPGNAMHIPFRFSLTQQYTLVVSAQNIDVFRDDAAGSTWLSAIAAPVSEAMIARLNHAQRLDGLILYHEDLKTQLIERQALETEWNIRPYPYENLRDHDYGGTYANGVTAKQRITTFGEGTGDTFTVTLEGATTASITLDATGSVTAAALKAALEALSNVGTGLTVTYLGDNDFEVEFTGTGNADRPWDLMVCTTSIPGFSLFISHQVEGRFPGEPIISDAQGWPRAGALSQQRHLIAGLKNLPLRLLASVTTDPFDFNSELAVASGGFDWELDADAADGILDMVVARNLVVFTENEAYYNAEQVLDATAAPAFRKIDQVGLEPGVPVVLIEGGLIFIERGGHVMRQMQYTDLQQSYATGALSTLSGHLFEAPVDMARRRPVAGDRSDLIHIVNDAAGVVLATMQRAEQVIGFTRADYAGRPLAVSCNEDGIVRFTMRRTLGGATRNWLERHDRDLWLECASKVTGSDIAVAAGLDLYEGDTVRVMGAQTGKGWADEGLQEVANGEVTVATAADAVLAGFDLFADIVDMPVNRDHDAQRVLGRMKRVHTLKIALFETTSCAVQVNGGDVIDLPLDQISQAMFGSSIADRPFTGTVKLEGFMGFTADAQVRVTQVRPGSLTVKALTKEMVV